MAGTYTISATEFKAKCLDILDRLATGQLERVVVTKRGRSVAVLSPPEPNEASVRATFGFMAGSVIMPQGFDLTEPVLDEPLDADHGILHR